MEAVKMMSGPIGSNRINFEKKRRKKAIIKKIVREIIKIKSVEAKILTIKSVI